MGVTIDAQGFEEADRLLAQLELSMRGPALQRALREAGRVVLKEAKRRVPHGLKTGTSDKKSKKKEHEKSKRLKSALRTIVREYPGKALAVVGADYDKGPHAHLVEEGHEEVLWGKRTGARVEGKEFLAPAADSTKHMQTIALLGSLQKTIREAGG